MGDPHLLRAVWLTREQRGMLRLAVDEVLADSGDHDLLPSLLAELILVEKENRGLEQLTRSVVRGLRLPAGTLPVHVCDAQVDELIMRGLLNEDLCLLLKPPPYRYRGKGKGGDFS